MEEVCVCVCWHFVDIQKKRQDPVSKHLFRLKSEWAALKRATQSWVKCFSSIPLSGRSPPSPPPHHHLLSYLMLSFSVLAGGWLAEGGVGGAAAAADVPRPLLPSRRGKPARPRANPKNRFVLTKAPLPQKSSFPKKGTTKSKIN